MASIARRQAAFIEDGLGNLGSSSRDENLSLNNIEAVLFDFLVDFIQKGKDNLQANESVNTGGLVDSFKGRVTFAGSKYTATVSLADYYDFVNKGVQGLGPGNKNTDSPYAFRTKSVSKPMMESIRKWMIREGLKLTREDAPKFGGMQKKKSSTLFKENKTTSLAYAIAASIKRKGLKKTEFFDKAYASAVPSLQENLAKAMKEDVLTVIRRIKSNI